jgi:hypothetical protein
MHDAHLPFLRNNNYAADIDLLKCVFILSGRRSRQSGELSSLVGIVRDRNVVNSTSHQSTRTPALRGDRVTATQKRPRIAVIVPARDETGNICRCVNSLLAPDCPVGRFNVIAVGDH